MSTFITYGARSVWRTSWSTGEKKTQIQLRLFIIENIVCINKITILTIIITNCMCALSEDRACQVGVEGYSAAQQNAQ